MRLISIFIVQTMTPEEVLNQISDGIWVNKGGLKVPTEIVQAL